MGRWVGGRHVGGRHVGESVSWTDRPNVSNI